MRCTIRYAVLALALPLSVTGAGCGSRDSAAGEADGALAGPAANAAEAPGAQAAHESIPVPVVRDDHAAGPEARAAPTSRAARLVPAGGRSLETSPSAATASESGRFAEEEDLPASDVGYAGSDAVTRSEPPALRIAAGANLMLRFDETLSTATSREGDVFYAEVIEDVLDGRGTVLVPIGAVVRGRVTQADRSTTPDQEPILAISVDALMIDGTEYPIAASVVQAQPAVTRGDADVETAAKIATGTAAGALVGRILGGDRKGTLVGAAVGAAAGTAVAVKDRTGDATLREGSVIVIRLDEAVTLRY
ncbi:MAG: hypothetical protein HY701_11845 [Gemmatimonadetes bacterium]|nr:hypothetical protein [Gemmatimonadota bacterium]